MQILLYEWNSIGQQDLEDTLIDMGNTVEKIRYIFEDFENDEAFEQRMSNLLLLKHYDCVISFNYFQVISKVCNTFHLKYIAWIWDSPLINAFSKTVYNPCNYIFVFDKKQYFDLQKLGVNTIYYMPLASNVDRLDSIVLSDVEWETYSTDVSFVGNLYEKRNHYDYITNLPEYLRGYFDGIMNAQMKIHGYNFIEEMLTDDITKELLQYITINMGKNYIGDTKSVFADRFINAKITGMERRAIFSKLADCFNVTIYTESLTDDMPRIQNKGYADYFNVMPKVFKASKININITSRTIKSGIPLRVFDVLGAGGFLITNYQSEIPDHFEMGKDLVCYENEEDLIAKIQYYLQHEDERVQIANNGYQKVKKYHNYKRKLEEIFRIVFEDVRDVVHVSEINYGYEDDIKTNRLMIKNQLKELISQGTIEMAMNEYFTACREESSTVEDDEWDTLGVMFDIYNYEYKKKQHTLFDDFNTLEEVYQHFYTLRDLITNVEIERTNETFFRKLIEYIDVYSTSYTAIQCIINKYAKDKVKLLNDVAILFFNSKRNEMVIPFLSMAYDFDPMDKRTLHNLGYVLYELGEYEAALEYLLEMSEPSCDTLELIDKIAQKHNK